MELAAVAEMLSTTGFAVVLMAYFLVKDWKFNQSILDVLSEVKDVLTELKTWHKMEGEK